MSSCAATPPPQAVARACGLAAIYASRSRDAANRVGQVGAGDRLQGDCPPSSRWVVRTASAKVCLAAQGFLGSFKVAMGRGQSRPRRDWPAAGSRNVDNKIPA